MCAALSISEIWSKFDRIRIKHPRLEEAHKWFDALREAKRKSPRSPQKFATIFAPTHSGKTMSIRTYIETKVVDDVMAAGLLSDGIDRETIARDQKIALHVTLSTPATTRSLAFDILVALGDPAPHGTELTMKKRCYDLMRSCGTELLFIDEIQHLSTSRARTKSVSLTDSTSVTNTMKIMLLVGLVPIVFVGIPEARHHLFGDRQIGERCVKEIDFGPLDLHVPKERKTFVEYCGRLGLKLRQHEIFDDETDLVSGDIPTCLHAVSGGRIGTVSNVVQAACIIAFEQGASRVDREHLLEATDDWAIANGLIDYNPFRDGPREIKLAS